MSTFRVDNDQINASVDTLRKLLNKCEELYNKEIPVSDQDKGQTHDELAELCNNIKATCFYLGELINNTILFLGKSSDMFEKSDKDSADKISDYTSESAAGASVVVATTDSSAATTSTNTNANVTATPTKNNTTATMSAATTVDVGGYTSDVTDVELARLCYHIGQVKSCKDPEVEFINRLYKDLPKGDPLKNISTDQVNYTEFANGFSAITISDGDTAFVIFSGTNQLRDIDDDARLALSLPSSRQAHQAINLVDDLSKSHSNIVVTGHSLGGFLATSATLKNDTISKCVTFDAPGRFDVEEQTMKFPDRVNKITTYQAKDDIISNWGDGVGHEKPVSVNPAERNGPLDIDWVFPYHGIKQMCDALGGKDAINKSWGNES